MHQELPARIPTYIRERMANAILPVNLAAALTALAKCRTIDESKYWADKADALAAWARIYQNDEASAEAKRLKAHAFRRMSRLSDELAIASKPRGKPGRASPAEHLKAAGLSKAKIARVRQVGAVPDKKFADLLSLSNPPSIGALALHGVGAKGGKAAGSVAWRTFAGGKYTHTNGHKFRQFCRTHSALELGREIAPGEVLVAKKLLSELREWLDEFETSLPPPA